VTAYTPKTISIKPFIKAVFCYEVMQRFQPGDIQSPWAGFILVVVLSAMHSHLIDSCSCYLFC